MYRLAKSRYLKGRHCHRRLWLTGQGESEPELESEEVWEEREAEGAEVERHVATLFPEAIRIDEAADQEEGAEERPTLEQNINRTRDLLKQGRPLLQAHLANDELLAIVDILEPNGEGWFLWEIKASTECKPIFAWDLAYQCEVARRNGLVINGAGVIYLNKTYRRGEELDIDQMTIQVDQSGEVAAIEDQVRAEIAEQLLLLGEATLPSATPTSRCKGYRLAKAGDRPSDCGHLASNGTCGAKLPAHWAWRLSSLRGIAKKDHINSLQSPSVELLNADDDSMSWTAPQKRMIRAVHQGAPIIEQDVLHAELAKLSWPVAYIDFEFDPGMAVPRYVGSRPYERIPFQWSMQIQRNPGEELEDVEPFLQLGSQDPRRPFAEALLNAIPKEGSIVVHYKSAEETVLKQLAKFLGEPYKRAFIGLMKRIFDTEALLRKCYYHPQQQGSYSIKKAAPALLGHGYEGLEIQDGMAAVVAWKRTLSGDCGDEERALIGRHLLEYCGRDTQLMHDILEALRRLMT